MAVRGRLAAWLLLLSWTGSHGLVLEHSSQQVVQRTVCPESVVQLPACGTRSLHVTITFCLEAFERFRLRMTVWTMNVFAKHLRH
eukprot:3942858-Amphidinium_carterae.1